MKFISELNVCTTNILNIFSMKSDVEKNIFLIKRSSVFEVSNI